MATSNESAEHADEEYTGSGGGLPSAFDEEDKGQGREPASAHDYGDDGGEDFSEPGQGGDEGDDAGDQPPAPRAAQANDGKVPAPKPPKQQQPAHQFSEDLLEEAELYGFDPKDYASEADLERDIRRFDKQVLAWGGQSFAPPAQQHQQSPQQYVQQEPVQQRQAPPPQRPQQQQAPAKFELKLPDRDMMDPDVHDAIKGMHDYYEQREAEREQRLAALEGHYRQSQEEVYAKQLDDFFSGLGDEYADLFGKGPIHALKPESPEAANALKVLEAADALAMGFASQGKRIPNDTTLLKKALLATFPDRQTQTTRNQILRQLRNRQGQFTARPTHRGGKPLTGEEARIANIRSRMIAAGMTPSDDDDDDSDDGI